MCFDGRVIGENIMNQSELRWTGVEEASLPQNPSQEQLRLWNISKGTVVSFEDVCTKLPPVLCTDVTSFLLAEQHKLGLSPAIKRHRLHPERQGDIQLRANENLPFYLQDVEKHNPELMQHVTTEVHLTMPTVAEIAEERRLEEESHIKSWSHGVVLKNHLGFQLSSKTSLSITASAESRETAADETRTLHDDKITPQIDERTPQDDSKTPHDDVQTSQDDVRTPHDDAGCSQQA